MLNVSFFYFVPFFFFLPTASNPTYSFIRGRHGSDEPTNCVFGIRTNYQFFGSYKYKGEYHKPDGTFRNDPYGGFCAAL